MQYIYNNEETDEIEDLYVSAIGCLGEITSIEVWDHLNAIVTERKPQNILNDMREKLYNLIESDHD